MNLKNIINAVKVTIILFVASHSTVLFIDSCHLYRRVCLHSETAIKACDQNAVIVSKENTVLRATVVRITSKH